MPPALQQQSNTRHHHLSLLLRLAVVILLVVAICPLAKSQRYIEDSLVHSCQSAVSDSDRIVKMGRLSDYYYANKKFNSGDSLIEKQIMLAEASLNQRLVLLAYFGNAGYNYSGASTKDHSQNTIEYIKRAMEYAKANDLTDYMALAYANLSALYISDGRNEDAFKNASLGFTTALNTNNDSAKVICAVQLGNIYLQRSDVLTAFRTFTNAYNIAIENGNELLLPPVLHAMANLYKKLGKEEITRNYLFRSLAINKRQKNIAGQIDDNIFLAKVSNYTAAKDYLQQAIRLADTIQNARQKIYAEKILFSYMLQKETPSNMLAFLEKQAELKNVFLNTGPNYMNWMLAEIYLYASRPDSALYYFKTAETSFNTGYDLISRKNFFTEYAYCFQQLSKVPEAITYYQKSTDLARAASDLHGLKNHANELKALYEQQGDYKQAYQYNILYDHYKDSVDLLGREKDLALLEIENETKQQQRDAEIAQEQLRRKYNLQYMLITIIIAVVFVALIMVGMFKVSTFTIRLMGFLSLVFLFEFIILVLDKWIHDLTHGEPWKSWLIKIGIISVLLPIHHFIEHKLIRYLLSRHLITVRNRISLKSLFVRVKKTSTEKNSVEENITTNTDNNS